MKAVINKLKNIHIWYYPLVLSVYMLALASTAVFRPGVASAVMVGLVFVSLIIRVQTGESNSLHNINESGNGSLHNANGVRGNGLHNAIKNFLTEDIIMTLWFGYNILSGIWCVAFGMPLSVYLGELFTTALPMCFYYCGRWDRSSEHFSRNFLISVAVIGIAGIILFITGPEFYIDYLMKLQLISKADVSTMRVRMHSVIGSTLMGFLPTVGMLLSVRMITDSKEKRGRMIYALSFVFMLLLAFLSNQRSAMAGAIFIILYLNYLVFFVFRLFPKKYVLAEAAVIAGAVAAFFLIFNGAFMKVYYRLVSLPGSIAQRSDQWVGAANNMKNIWLGNGLGANGHRAIGFTEHLIADGGIAKLYVESGIIGTALFVFLILLVLKKGLKNAERTAPEAGIIIVTLLMSIGSNMMSFALSVPVFYYCIGSCVRLYKDAATLQKASVSEKQDGYGS